MTIIHSSTTETVRLPQTDSDPAVTHHPAIRSKLPLKQKVRNGKKRRQQRPKEGSSSNSSPKKRAQNATKARRKTIDYSKSNKQKLDSPEDPVNKVQNWLLTSQVPGIIPKSKSTPVGLTGCVKKSDSDKVRLQVIYKPPFKLSLKLKRADKSVFDRGRVADRRRSAIVVRSKRLDTAPPVRLDTGGASQPAVITEDFDSNIHTVQSDLEVLLSESEFLFSE